MTDEIRQLREEVAQLSAELTRLTEIEAVRRCKYQYWRCFDTADIDGMREVLHPDVELSVVAGCVYSMKYQGREGYLEMVRTGAHADMISHHNGHHPEIDIVGPEEAIGTWYLYDDLYEYRRNMRLYGTAFYRDRYVKHEGRGEDSAIPSFTASMKSPTRCRRARISPRIIWARMATSTRAPIHCRRFRR